MPFFNISFIFATVQDFRMPKPDYVSQTPQPHHCLLSLLPKLHRHLMSRLQPNSDREKHEEATTSGCPRRTRPDPSYLSKPRALREICELGLNEPDSEKKNWKIKQAKHKKYLHK
jgi:hypothetical protein